MMELPLEIVIVDIDKKSQNLTENVAPDQSLKCTLHNHEAAFNRIFRSDVAVCNCSYHSQAEIHSIEINLIPRQEDELVKGPTVVNPYYVWCIRTVVIALVERVTYFVEDDSHEMTIEISIDNQFQHQEESIANQRQLRESLYFCKNIAESVQFQQPEYFEPVDSYIATCQRQQNGKKCKQIHPQLQSHIILENQRDIFYQESLVIVFFQRRYQNVDKEYQYEKYLKTKKYRHFVLPELLFKCEDKTQFYNKVNYNKQKQHIPAKDV